MVRFKGLYLVKVAFIIMINLATYTLVLGRNINDTIKCVSQIDNFKIFIRSEKSKDIVTLLPKKDFIVSETKSEFRIKILKKALCSKIHNITSPEITIEFHGVRYKVALINLIQASLPDSYNYFISVDNYGKIILFSKNILVILKRDSIGNSRND
jgi:hypothetical protein